MNTLLSEYLNLKHIESEKRFIIRLLKCSRLIRLFVCALWNEDHPIVLAAEEYADGKIPFARLRELRRDYSRNKIVYLTFERANSIVYPTLQWHSQTQDKFRRRETLLPFISGYHTAYPEWKTSTTRAIAQGMYTERDFSATPILADALQDAGCVHNQTLEDLRNPEHKWFRGHHLIDFLRS